MHTLLVFTGIPHEAFDRRLERLKKETGKKDDTSLTAEDLQKLCNEYRQVYVDNNHVFPD